MNFNKLNISDLIDQQLPDFVVNEFPLFVKFFEEYYKSLEISGGVLNITNNLLEYKNIDNLRKFNLVKTYILTESVDTDDTIIKLDKIDGLPLENGIISIGNEVIFYEKVDSTTTSLLECKRGYTATTKLSETATTVEKTESSSHNVNSVVTNL